MTMSMARCQEQRRSVVAGEDEGQDDGVGLHHATQNSMKFIYLLKKNRGVDHEAYRILVTPTKDQTHAPCSGKVES